LEWEYDKRDIRFVAHYHLPGSIEAYYQEVGRAGRDGLPADCLLLFNYADTRTQQFFIEGNHPPPDLIRRVYHEIASFGLEKIEMSARELAQRLGEKNDMSIYSALVVLEKAGHIERGRMTDKNIIARLTARVDAALDQVDGESTEGAVLRELIFNRDINDREQTEIELTTMRKALDLDDGQIRRALRGLSARSNLAPERVSRARNSYSTIRHPRASTQRNRLRARPSNGNFANDRVTAKRACVDSSEPLAIVKGRRRQTSGLRACHRPVNVVLNGRGAGWHVTIGRGRAPPGFGCHGDRRDDHRQRANR
jgi:superfamily II DNA helicase RecQ